VAWSSFHAHDYFNHNNIGINIEETLIKTIQGIGSHNIIQIITNNAIDCKAVGAVVKDMYPNIFWYGRFVHTSNLLVPDIIKLKEHDYK
jgi:hypothetical protein